MAVGREDTAGDGPNAVTTQVALGPWRVWFGLQYNISYRGHRCGYFAEAEGSPIFIMCQIYTLSEAELGKLMDSHPGRDVVLLTNGKEMDEEQPGEFILPKTKIVKAGSL